MIFLTGEEDDRRRIQYLFLGSGQRLHLLRVIILEVCDCLNCRVDFAWLENDVGE